MQTNVTKISDWGWEVQERMRGIKQGGVGNGYVYPI